MKKLSKKLKLSRETLALLENGSLSEVAGGTATCGVTGASWPQTGCFVSECRTNCVGCGDPTSLC